MKYFTVGALAVLEACGPFERNDFDSLPQTAIEDLVKNPESFAEHPLVKTEGYLTSEGTRPFQEYVGHSKKTGSIPMGKGMSVPIYTTKYTWDDVTLNAYRLHQTLEGDGVSFGVVSENQIIIKTGSNELDPNHKIILIGKIKTLKDASGAQVKVLSYQLAFDKEAPEMEKSQ